MIYRLGRVQWPELVFGLALFVGMELDDLQWSIFWCFWNKSTIYILTLYSVLQNRNWAFMFWDLPCTLVGYYSFVIYHIQLQKMYIFVFSKPRILKQYVCKSACIKLHLKFIGRIDLKLSRGHPKTMSPVFWTTLWILLTFFKPLQIIIWKVHSFISLQITLYFHTNI